jgi:hypothetical protein
MDPRQSCQLGALNLIEVWIDEAGRRVTGHGSRVTRALTSGPYSICSLIQGEFDMKILLTRRVRRAADAQRVFDQNFERDE